MRPVEASVDVALPADAVWRRLSDLSSHSEWMSDALGIRFETPQRRGVGVRMEVPTRVGPLRVIDRMEVDEWVDGRRIGVQHVGRVSGWGRFDLADNHALTTLTLLEQLRFPWYMGGAATELLARPVLRRIFQANLERFRRWAEAAEEVGT